MPAPRPANVGIAPLAVFPDAVEEEPAAELLAVDDVPFCALAAAWNAAKLLGPVSTAFALNTIPEPQCPACLQYAQIGVVSFTLMV